MCQWIRFVVRIIKCIDYWRDNIDKETSALCIQIQGRRWRIESCTYESLVQWVRSVIWPDPLPRIMRCSNKRNSRAYAFNDLVSAFPINLYGLEQFTNPKLMYRMEGKVTFLVLFVQMAKKLEFSLVFWNLYPSSVRNIRLFWMSIIVMHSKNLSWM